MPGNSIGTFYRFTSFGESHGNATGGVIDGCPAGLRIDLDFIQQELDRRKPLYPGSTARMEPDRVEFLSGMHEGISLGTPIGFLVKNLAGNPSDYDEISNFYRPSHADFTYEKKYGPAGISGGGRASGRETISRVIGGAVAKLILNKAKIEIRAFVSQIGPIADPSEQQIAALIDQAEKSGDTLGGTITCRIKATPVGLGEPVFDKLQADLAKAMLSIGSAKAFEYGLGFQATAMKGSEYNDQMSVKDGRIVFMTNHDGGIQGGISNGEEIYFRVGFKPVPSVHLSQSALNRQGEAAEILIKGRHDTCHIPRLVVVVEAMAAMVMADHYLRNAGSGLI